MEEELKKIELFIKKNRIMFEDWGDMEVNEYELRSIENLIKEYKNLQQIEQEHKKENGALRERIKELEEKIDKYGGIEELENYILELSRFLGNVSIDAMIGTIKNNYIPKSKIQEKIEEYEQVIEITKEKLKYEANVDVRRRYTITIEQGIAGILSLQQLLEE